MVSFDLLSKSHFRNLSKFVVLTLCLCNLSYAKNIENKCTLDGVKLNGRVKIVDSFATFKVKKVKAFADLKVKFVDSFANKCGRWQIVDTFEDFSVEFVDAFEDFSIIESEFPGVR